MPEEAKSGIQLASQANLLARFNQLCKFGVNFVTSQELGGDWSLLPEEVGLSSSLYSMLIDLECGVSRKKAGYPPGEGPAEWDLPGWGVVSHPAPVQHVKREEDRPG